MLTMLRLANPGIKVCTTNSAHMHKASHTDGADGIDTVANANMHNIDTVAHVNNIGTCNSLKDNTTTCTWTTIEDATKEARTTVPRFSHIPCPLLLPQLHKSERPAPLRPSSSSLCGSTAYSLMASVMNRSKRSSSTEFASICSGATNALSGLRSDPFGHGT